MPKPAKRKGKPPDQARMTAVLKERVAVAEEMAASPTVTVTLRLPSAFNEWLDAYRHLSYPQRVGKQELVVEGLKMVYARRGRAGEAVLSTERVVSPRRPRLRQTR
jgi:hypothetical protein